MSIHAELETMEHLSDEMLWQIAQSTMDRDKVALYDVLLEHQQADSLDSKGQKQLACLRQEADVLMLRKAHAYTLLQGRGHELPSLQELRTLTL